MSENLHSDFRKIFSITVNSNQGELKKKNMLFSPTYQAYFVLEVQIVLLKAGK